jgi:hypothetical protein
MEANQAIIIYSIKQKDYSRLWQMKSIIRYLNAPAMTCVPYNINPYLSCMFEI